jgi:hypothetical protein
MIFASEQDYVNYTQRDNLSIEDLKAQFLALLERFKEECVTNLNLNKSISDLKQAEDGIKQIYIDLEIEHQHLKEEAEALIEGHKISIKDFKQQIEDLKSEIVNVMYPYTRDRDPLLPADKKGEQTPQFLHLLGKARRKDTLAVHELQFLTSMHVALEACLDCYNRNFKPAFTEIHKQTEKNAVDDDVVETIPYTEEIISHYPNPFYELLDMVREKILIIKEAKQFRDFDFQKLTGKLIRYKDASSSSNSSSSSGLAQLAVYDIPSIRGVLDETKLKAFYLKVKTLHFTGNECHPNTWLGVGANRAQLKLMAKLAKCVTSDEEFNEQMEDTKSFLAMVESILRDKLHTQEQLLTHEEIVEQNLIFRIRDPLNSDKNQLW